MNDGISPTPNPELQDQGNLARSGASDESLQRLRVVPLQLLVSAKTALRDVGGSYAREVWCELRDAIERKDAALANRTPARQEAEPDGNESVSALLPVQGQEPWDEALHGYTLLGSTKAYCCYGMYADVGHSSDCKHALRASSAPTTKG